MAGRATAWPGPGPVGAMLVSAVLLVWPALMNAYPLVFVDTAAYLRHTILREAPWDKTAAYGPFLLLFHQGTTLWLPLAAQGLMLSWLLWLVQRVALGEAFPARHLLLCGLLAALTAAPWFTAMLMPDVFTPVVVLCTFLLGFGEDRLHRLEMLAVGLMGALGVAVHLSHLPTALALVALVLLARRRWRPVLRVCLPLAAAMLFLLGANWHNFGRATLSAHGSIFLFARLQADGPAVATLRDRCPAAGWYLCDFIDAMPMDSDHFLWNPNSPPSRDAAGHHRPMGSVMLAPEAAQVVAATLRDHPWAVARAALGNWADQLVKVRVGDTHDNADLDEFAGRVLARGFPASEVAAFQAAAQMQGTLERRAAPFLLPHVPLLLLSLPLLLAATWLFARRQDTTRLGLVLCVLVGVAGNAFATGALSKPHHRYQARIAWLLPMAAALALWPAARLAGAVLPMPQPAPGGRPPAQGAWASSMAPMRNRSMSAP